MELSIDLSWILEVQERYLPDEVQVRDFSALGAAVERHRFAPVVLGHDPDAAWRAAALLHTIVRLEPLHRANRLLGCMVAIAYMEQSGEAIDPQPHGALPGLAQAIDAKKADVFAVAEQLRAWRV